MLQLQEIAVFPNYIKRDDFKADFGALHNVMT